MEVAAISACIIQISRNFFFVFLCLRKWEFGNSRWEFGPAPVDCFIYANELRSRKNAIDLLDWILWGRCK